MYNITSQLLLFRFLFYHLENIDIKFWVTVYLAIRILNECVHDSKLYYE